MVGKKGGFGINILIILIIALLFSSGCSTNSLKDKQDIDYGPIKISKSLWPGQFWKEIADSKGWFEEAGLDVELIDTNEDYYGSLQDMVDGKMDINAFPTFDFVNYVAQDNDLVTIIYTDISWGIDGIASNLEIDSIGDLRGKKIGFIKDSYSEYMLNVVLGNIGLTMDDIVAVEVSSENIEPFVNGDIDAFVSWEPYLTESAEKGNGHVLFDTSKLIGLNSGVEVVHQSFIDERPKDVQAYVGVWYKTVKFIEQNPDEAFGIIAEIYGMSLSEVVEFAKLDKITTLEDNEIALVPSQKLDSLHRSMEFINNFLITKGLVDKQIDTSEVIDPRFIKKLT